MAALPQLIYIVLMALSLGLNFASHGKPREPGNAWYAVAALAIVLPLLWWGGFFDPLLSHG